MVRQGTAVAGRQLGEPLATVAAQRVIAEDALKNSRPSQKYSLPHVNSECSLGVADDFLMMLRQ